MKQFKKWFWDEYDPHDDSYGESSQIIAQAGWKAALMWAEDRISQSTCLGDALSKIVQEIESEYDE